ncbi:hypothetical protein D9758_005969 [Tetrapyrgos nigripes]|uniref:EthD domain-containing protein n=1 Tax=Tetrapyrgos nigripes TaxID=182062 RepID=A0A8H5G2X7_9AGAR|nr:hypothetical protein D9758_005969 [Tetrapyrgos nigripes]
MATHVFSPGSEDRLLVILGRSNEGPVELEGAALVGHLRNLLVPAATSDYQVYISSTSESEAAVPMFGIFCLYHSSTSVISENFTDEVKCTLESAKSGLGLDCRLYSTHSQNPVALTNSMPMTHTLVFNAMTPSTASEQSFNDWYAEEHIPLLSRVPGWLASRRFKLISATMKAPAYLALHAFTSVSAFEQREYEAATNTPWRTEVIGQVIEKERIVLERRRNY